MIRLRQVRSAKSDPDVEAQLDLVSILPRVDHLADARALEDNLSLIVRRAVQTWRDEDADILLTVGEAALVSASLSWRGPLVHLPIGRVSKTERRLLRWRNGPSTACVVSSHFVANDAIAGGVPDTLLRVIRPAPPPLHATRDEIRATLGIAPAAVCVLIAGRVGRIGGHYAALCASAVLSFRDPSWRVLIDPGTHADYALRFARNSSVPGSVVLCDQCSASELAAAADVALVDPEDPPCVVAIASAARHRVPLVASPRLWREEQLSHVPALLVAEARYRSWARAALHAAEGSHGLDLDRAARAFDDSTQPRTLTHQWLEVLHAVCRSSRGLSPGLSTHPTSP